MMWLHYAVAALSFVLWTRLAWRLFRYHRRGPVDSAACALVLFMAFLSLTPVWLYRERVEPDIILGVHECLGSAMLVLFHVALWRQHRREGA